LALTLDLSRISNIGRSFSLSYPRHRRLVQIAAWGGLAAGGVSVLKGQPAPQSLWTGLNTFLAALVAWAVARELDPDREPGGHVAAGWAVAAALIFGPLPLLPAALFIGFGRLLTRIVGLVPLFTDALGLLLVPLGMMLYHSDPLYGLLPAIAFALDAVFERELGRSAVFALLAAAATAAQLILAGVPPHTVNSQLTTLIAGAVAFLTVLKLFRMGAIRVKTDVNGLPVSLARVRAFTIFALVMALLPMLQGNDSRFLRYAPLWAALLGAAL
jgi:hypothetical protein